MPQSGFFPDSDDDRGGVCFVALKRKGLRGHGFCGEGGLLLGGGGGRGMWLRDMWIRSVGYGSGC